MQRGDDRPVRVGFTVTKKVGNRGHPQPNAAAAERGGAATVAGRTRHWRRPGAGGPRHHANPSVRVADRGSAPWPGKAGRDCSGPVVSLVAAGLAMLVRALPADLAAAAGARVPVHPKLQRLRDRSPAHAWRPARHMARRMARGALQSLLCLRLRSRASARLLPAPTQGPLMDQKRLPLFIALSIAILLGLPVFGAPQAAARAGPAGGGNYAHNTVVADARPYPRPGHPRHPTGACAAPDERAAGDDRRTAGDRQHQPARRPAG